MLDVKELTIWEAVALRALFHLQQELVSFVDAKEMRFRNCVEKLHIYVCDLLG